MGHQVVRVEAEWIHHTTPQPPPTHSNNTARLTSPHSPLRAPQSEHLTVHLGDTVEQPPTQSGDVETPPYSLPCLSHWLSL